MTRFGRGERNPLCLHWALLIFIVIVSRSGFGLGAAQFRASVVKIDINPNKPQWLLGYGPRQPTGVTAILRSPVSG